MGTPNIFEGSTILITGGTGTFGKPFTRKILTRNPKIVRILCHSEKGRSEAMSSDPRLRFPMGDVRIVPDLWDAMEDVDYVVHAAAIKEIDNADYSKRAARTTNVDGSINVRDIALARGVKRVIALSTDKAVEPCTYYGLTKALMEAEILDGHKHKRTLFACTRYGNVIDSRASVIPKWREQAKTGAIDITHPNMTRFWMTLNQGVQFVLNCLEQMEGGEIFVPHIPSMRLLDLAHLIAPESKHNIIGLRANEKLHEVLLSKNESYKAREFPKAYVIKEGFETNLPQGFEYRSDANRMLDEDEMRWLL